MGLLSLTLALVAGEADAGTRIIQVDNFQDNTEAAFQGGFAQYECWATIYTPDAGDFPLTARGVDVLLGGSENSEEYLLQLYNLTELRFNLRWIYEEVFTVAGSNDSLSRLEFSEDTTINSGHIGIAMCHESLANPGTASEPNYPGPAADGNGIDVPDRNWIGAFEDGFRTSASYGVSGDWVMRLCIEGANISGNECGEGTEPDDWGNGGDDTGDWGSTGDFYLQSITPNFGVVGEGTDVILVGDGFVPGTQARIGGISLTGTDVLNAETIAGRVPTALGVGLHDVEVVLPSGESSYLPGAFEVGKACGCATLDGYNGRSALAALIALIGLVGLRRREA